MNDIRIHITEKYIYGIYGIVGLLGFSYLLKRYFSNVNDTTNKYYVNGANMNNDENTNANLPGINMIKFLKSPNQKKVYIFWNGSLGSTYLLIDFLIQDYIIQPFYIEQFSIIKQLDKEHLDSINIKIQKKIENSITPKEKQYLRSISKIKTQQLKDIKQLEILIKLIVKQYPEFQTNLLPIKYITTIQKDLTFTNLFFNTLKECNPMGYDNIEILEQIIRFWKYYSVSKDFNIVGDRYSSRVVIGFTKDNKNSTLVERIIYRLKILNAIDNVFNFPIINVSNNDLKFKASMLLSSDFIHFFNKDIL